MKEWGEEICKAGIVGIQGINIPLARQEGVAFLCRAKRSVMVYLQGQIKGQTLGRFKIKPGQILRYSVLYHSQKKEPLDLIIYFGKGYKEAWYLLVPSRTSLTAEEIVELHAKRM